MTTRCLIGVVVGNLSAPLAVPPASAASPEVAHASVAPARTTAASNRLLRVIVPPLVEIGTPTPIEPSSREDVTLSRRARGYQSGEAPRNNPAVGSAHSLRAPAPVGRCD